MLLTRIELAKWLDYTKIRLLVDLGVKDNWNDYGLTGLARQFCETKKYSISGRCWNNTCKSFANRLARGN